MNYNTAYDFLRQFDFEEVRRNIYAQTSADVERALSHNHRDVEDFFALISPAAESYLEPMAQEAHRLTLERFGRTMQLYLPHLSFQHLVQQLSCIVDSARNTKFIVVD